MTHPGAAARWILTGLFSAALFGAATPASKLLLQDLQPQVLAGLLYLGAALGVLPAVLRRKGLRWPWRAGRRTGWLLTGAVVMGGILGPLLVLLALQSAHAGSVSLWLNLEFVATLLLGHFLFREQLAPRAWTAAGGTLLAALLLAGGQGAGGGVPAGLIALGCICWGFDNHWTALIDGLSPAETTLWKGIVAGAFNLFAGSALTGGLHLSGGVLTALLVGAFSYGLSITLYVTAAQGLGATRSQMLFSTAPFFGLLLSVVIVGEVVSGIQVLAAGLMALSLVVLFSDRHGHVHRHDRRTHQHAHRHDDHHHDHRHDEIVDPQHHSHWHEHAPREHHHPHWPDLHHRHEHEKDPKA